MYVYVEDLVNFLIFYKNMLQHPYNLDLIIAGSQSKHEVLGTDVLQYCKNA